MSRSSRPGVGWVSVLVIAALLTWIALGHSGSARGAAAIRPIPFLEYGWALSCLAEHCRSAYRAAGFVIVNGLGNIVVFVPLGMATCTALWCEGRRGRSILLAGLIGLGLSLAYEIAQLWIPGRVTATDDIILNTAGAWLGARVAALWLARAPVAPPI